jgi:hypothetical protein
MQAGFIEALENKKCKLIARAAVCEEQIKKSQEILNKLISELSKEEFLLFGLEQGYITKADYDIAMHKRKKK